MNHPAPRLLPAGCSSSTGTVPPAIDRHPDLLHATDAVEFSRMQRAFLPSGGLVDSQAFTAWLDGRMSQPVSRLARWIVAHEVISLPWQSRAMLPIFQFDADLAPHPAVTRVIRELYPVLEDWDIGLWFVEPNLWLDGGTPVDSIRWRPGDVFEAARGFRYLARA